ncbi:MAG TPA: hypothetical protein VGM75_30625 [Pseudonocardiaceae bacterium]
MATRRSVWVSAARPWVAFTVVADQWGRRMPASRNRRCTAARQVRASARWYSSPDPVELCHGLGTAPLGEQRPAADSAPLTM